MVVGLGRTFFSVARTEPGNFGPFRRPVLEFASDFFEILFQNNVM